MKSSSNIIANRKSEHIDTVLTKNVQAVKSGLFQFKLPYSTLPEVNYNDVDSGIDFLGKKLSFPFLISSMTGGPEETGFINKNLASAAEEMKVGLGLGSMRVVLKHPQTSKSFDVRQYCPSIPLFANIGLVQLNYGVGVDEINYLIKLFKADGIFLHVNPIQEVIQPEGDTNFAGLLDKLASIIDKIDGHVILKEVGTGFDQQTAQQLKNIGVKWIDVSGMGGTSWTLVEGHRRDDDLGELFRNEGYTTVESLKALVKVEGLNLIAGGGLRSGLDIAKVLMLGAEVATAGTPLLKPALESVDQCIHVINQLKKELQISMFIAGVKTIHELKSKSLIFIN